jgi:hypothetical protein
VFTIFNNIMTPHTCHAKHRLLSARIVRDFDLLIAAINEMNQVNIRHAEKPPPIDASMRAALSSLIRSVGLRVGDVLQLGANCSFVR